MFHGLRKVAAWRMYDVLQKLVALRGGRCSSRRILFVPELFVGEVGICQKAQSDIYSGEDELQRDVVKQFGDRQASPLVVRRQLSNDFNPEFSGDRHTCVDLAYGGAGGSTLSSSALASEVRMSPWAAIRSSDLGAGALFELPEAIIVQIQ